MFVVSQHNHYAGSAVAHCAVESSDSARHIEVLLKVLEQLAVSIDGFLASSRNMFAQFVAEIPSGTIPGQLQHDTQAMR